MVSIGLWFGSIDHSDLHDQWFLNMESFTAMLSEEELKTGIFDLGLYGAIVLAILSCGWYAIVWYLPNGNRSQRFYERDYWGGCPAGYLFCYLLHV
jgi:hypothetical protein